jgi:calcineurin-like phosphoesterase family protein
MKIKIDVSDGKDVFFISDFHIGHKNVIGFDNRPFRKTNGDPDVEAMHKTIIKNWNSVVNDNDVVFYLGDLCFGRPELANGIIHGLKGKIHYIMGNHDKYKDIAGYGRFESINDLVDLTISTNNLKDKLHFVLCHYPIFSWNRAHHGSIMIHGHCHGNLHHGEDAGFYNGRKVMDVGCNLINYTPISYKEVIQKFK